MSICTVKSTAVVVASAPARMCDILAGAPTLRAKEAARISPSWSE